MEKTINKECEIAEEVKQEQISKIDDSANKLDEKSLDSIYAGHSQAGSSGGGSRGSTVKPPPVIISDSTT